MQEYGEDEGVETATALSAVSRALG